VHLDGEVIPLKQENSLRIAGAVVELRRRSASAKEPSAAQEKALARLVRRLLERASAAGLELHLT
jgi:hypothetical protein